MSSDRLKWIVGCLAVTSVVSMVTGCSGYDDGLTKYPVTGSVVVNGQPEEGVLVRFYRVGRAGESNADTPAGVTDEAGRFSLSTNGENDGAVAGEYKVTFIWPEYNGPGAKDQFGGRYVEPAKSEFAVTVGEVEQELPVYELEAPDAPKSRRPGGSRRDQDGRR